MSSQPSLPPACEVIERLCANESVRVRLDCGDHHVFKPVDALLNQETVLMLASIEQRLALVAGCVAEDSGDPELCGELGVSSAMVPPLSALLRESRRFLPGGLWRELSDIKSVRDEVLHGGFPLFVRHNVEAVRRVYGSLVRFAPKLSTPALDRMIKACRTRQCVQNLRITSQDVQFIRDLMSLTAIERTLRVHLAEDGVAVRDLKVIECAHELMNVALVNRHGWPRGLMTKLRMVFILRNLLAHGGLLALSEMHHALVAETAVGLGHVMGGAAMAKAGGKLSLGDFQNNSFASGL